LKEEKTAEVETYSFFRQEHAEVSGEMQSYVSRG
jgi:hypothetical protein